MLNKLAVLLQMAVFKRLYDSMNKLKRSAAKSTKRIRLMKMVLAKLREKTLRQSFGLIVKASNNYVHARLEGESIHATYKDRIVE